MFRTITGDHYEAAREMARLALEHGRAPSNIDALVAVYLVHLNDVGRSRATLRPYEQLWRTWLSPMCGATTPDQLCRSDIEAALGAMHDAGQSQRSIHQAAVVLNTALAWAKENGLAAANVVIGCRLPDGSAITAARRRR